MGYYVFPSECLSVSLSVRQPVCPSALGCCSLTGIVFNGFYSNFAYTCKSGVSGFGLLMDKFCQYLTELSSLHMSIFSFADNNLSQYKSISTKLGMCMDFVELCFGISYGQILSIFDSYLPA